MQRNWIPKAAQFIFSRARTFWTWLNTDPPVECGDGVEGAAHLLMVGAAFVGMIAIVSVFKM